MSQAQRQQKTLKIIFYTKTIQQKYRYLILLVVFVNFVEKRLSKLLMRMDNKIMSYPQDKVSKNFYKYISLS